MQRPNALAYQMQPIELAATCFYESVSPVTTPKNGQQKLKIPNIHQSYRWTHINAGSDKSAAHGRVWVFQKGYRRLHIYEWLIR